MAGQDNKDDRGVEIQRDAQGNIIVTGDHNVINPPPSDPPASPPTADESRFPISNVEQQMTERRLFVGRKKQLGYLRKSLHANQAGALALTQAIHGLGGIGKTQLALQFAIDNASDYDIRWWIRAEQAATLTTDIAALAGPLGLSEDIVKADDQSITVNAVRQTLAGLGRWLLVFDNAESPAGLKDFLPHGDQGHVLITSRNPNWGQLASKFDVNILTMTDAKRLLKDRSEQKDDKAAEEVAKRLGRLPLALEVAGAYCEATGMALADYPAVLDEIGLELLDEHKPVDYEAVFTATWQPSFNAACKQCPPAAGVLALMSFLDPQDIPVWLLQKHFDHLKVLNDALGALRRYSLIERKDKMLSVHRLVQEVSIQQMPDEARTEWSEAAVQTVNAATPNDPHTDLSTWPTYEALLPHAVATVDHAQSLGGWGGTQRPPGEPPCGTGVSPVSSQDHGQDARATLAADASSRLLNVMAVYLQTRATFARAEALYCQVRDLNEQCYGGEHHKVAEALSNLATLYLSTNRLAEAEPLMRRALDIHEQSYGDQHPSVGVDLTNLAALLRATSRLAEAEPLYHRALAIAEHTYGTKHSEVAVRLNNLAQLFKDTDRVAQAEPLMRRALAIDEQACGAEHPRVAIRLNNLALWLLDANHLAEAEPLMRRALAIDEQAYGEKHPNVARNLSNLAWLLKITDRVEEAESLIRRAVAIDEQVYGDQHPDFAAHISVLARLLQDTDRLAEAEPLMRRAIEILVAFALATGHAHPESEPALGNYAHLLSDMGLDEEEVQQKVKELLPKL